MKNIYQTYDYDDWLLELDMCAQGAGLDLTNIVCQSYRAEYCNGYTPQRVIDEILEHNAKAAKINERVKR